MVVKVLELLWKRESFLPFLKAISKDTDIELFKL